MKIQIPNEFEMSIQRLDTELAPHFCETIFHPNASNSDAPGGTSAD